MYSSRYGYSDAFKITKYPQHRVFRSLAEDIADRDRYLESRGTSTKRATAKDLKLFEKYVKGQATLGQLQRIGKD